MMAKVHKLKTGSTTIKPHRKLGQAGIDLWQSVLREYHIDDVGGLELLLQACTQLDRAEQLRARIDRDGLIIETAKGPRDNPLLRHELAARCFVTRTLQR